MVKQKIFSILVLLLLFQYHSFAQRADRMVVDSLLRLLPTLKADSAKVNLYAELMLAHVYYKPEQGITYKQTALELAQTLNWKPGIAKIKHRAARLYWRMGNFKEALTFHKEALELYKQTNNTHAAGRVLIEIGQDYIDDGQLQEGRASLNEALKYNQAAGDLQNMATAYDILTYLYDVEGNSAAATQTAYDYLKLSEKLGDKDAIGHAAHMLASNYMALGNIPEALKYFKQGLQVSKETNNKIEQIYYYNDLGNIYIINKNFKEAEQHCLTALQLAKEVNDVQILANVYRKLGHYYRAIENYNEALSNYISSEAAYKSISSKQELAGLYADMATVYTSLKNYDKANYYFNASKNLYDALKSKMAMSDYYAGKQMYDSATGNWQSAYRHYKEYITIRDSAYSKESLKKLVGSQLHFENDKKEAIAKAEQEKKDLLAAEEIKRQRNIRNASFAVLAVVLVFSVIALYQRNKLAKEKKRSDQLLQDKELLLREIHHRVKNNLEVVSSLLALQSAQISDEQTKDAMQESQNRVQSIGIVHQKLYQGANLGAIEMKDYFINLSESILDSFGAEKRITIECAMEKLDVDIDTAVPLGLIVNELLTNTLKYAFPQGQQGKVMIKMQKQNNGVLQLEVSDNGVGKSGITHGTGFGGQLVSLLTQQLSGTMKEEVNDGTKIYFEFKTGKAA
ncbi:MAG: tetratricopeptide repeat protein [Chitinophagaceae bacterium]|jgi:two-component system, sensor histidine kinase PdtaS|nr:tetratricopeptide repeat protein [Chitinophagaceae bacterium]